jgi:hypothetical protein
MGLWKYQLLSSSLCIAKKQCLKISFEVLTSLDVILYRL